MPKNVLTNGNDTLIYRRKATHAKDNADGLLYLHRWPTGYQELIFRDEDAAQKWLDGNVSPSGTD